jgi:hypothetical protein
VSPAAMPDADPVVRFRSGVSIEVVWLACCMERWNVLLKMRLFGGGSPAMIPITHSLII